MSLFNAMNTAVSGLNAQSAAFGNISDNVANSQTIGFKRIDTRFTDYLTTSTRATNESGSVVARPDYVNDVQGTIQQTDNPLGLAITGQGFFTTARKVSTDKGEVVDTTNPRYTRAGDFHQDADGYLVNGSGDVLQGWKTDPSGSVVDRTTLSSVQVSKDNYPPTPTSSVTLSANLPSSLATGGQVASQVQLYDATGTPHTVQLQWTKNAADWTVGLTSADAASLTPASATVAFNPDGTIASIDGAGTSGSAASLPFSVDFGGGAKTVTLGLGTFGKAGGLTQYAGSTFTLNGLTQDGVAPGKFSSVTTRTNGDIVVNYDNGQSRAVYRVPVTTFPNPDGLQRQDGQDFTQTKEAGTAVTQEIGSNGAGSLVTGSVEQSNVDIAREFTKLIVAQRAYSANTKMVTTADELLQQTIDMKR